MRYVLVALPDSNNDYDDYQDMHNVGVAMYNSLPPNDTPPFIIVDENDQDMTQQLIDFTTKYDES